MFMTYEMYDIFIHTHVFSLCGLTVVPRIDRSFLPSEVNAEEGKDFKVVIPYSGGPVKAAKFSNVSLFPSQCVACTSSQSPV